MSESEFIAELTVVLDGQSDTARAQIPLLLASLPEPATRLDLQVFPAQDGDGFFTVRASVDGPNLYVINKAIDTYADLFDAKYTENGVQPPIPIVDCFDVDYPVNDIVVDCAANWLRTVWQSLGNIECRVPVVIVGNDGYGTVTPVELHSGAAA
ncbi:DUF6389 family protein [Allorhodopirellula solitaria]|uniref:Uncharacterized protein n=1 Tax=Allorhodopirellula solitaria TaxID=2527987 RepID=A0A5C5XXB3_9BACT|nr:DUF6389 family protein [Allorhodopirellula solitaria]TWT67589.1 hypothetical protein CA85_24420 [Allorhodopirellula solitaria]TWT67590.1 hypothetical protein CA85_24430 [Allorhodopirellula solitaria]